MLANLLTQDQSVSVYPVCFSRVRVDPGQVPPVAVFLLNIKPLVKPELCWTSGLIASTTQSHLVSVHPRRTGNVANMSETSIGVNSGVCLQPLPLTLSRLIWSQ